MAINDATKSMPEWIASERIATEPIMVPTINLNITRKEFDMMDKSATRSLRFCNVIKSTCNYDLKLFIGYSMTGALFPYFLTSRHPEQIMYFLCR
jgi:hypothetical protein